MLSMFGDGNATGAVLEKEDEVNCYLTFVMIASKTSGKSTHGTWLRFFNKGRGHRGEYVVEAFLDYYLIWLVLLRGSKDELIPYVFLLAILACQRGETGIASTIPGFPLCTN